MALDDYRQAQAASFGAAAAAYERGRPPYPSQAIDWLLPAGTSRVLDLGAGTGKLTGQLRERGLTVVAVEPSAGMRGQLRQAVPGVPVLGGTGEQIPLASGSADAVLVAQAWHWVDPARAVPEVARVLVPDGQLGLLWNIRDEREDWVAQLSAIMRTWEGLSEDSRNPPVGPPFGPVERRDVAWAYLLSPGALIDMVASRSYIITLAPARRAEVLAEVQRLLDTHPALAGASEITMPYITRCSRARLLS